jgi:hypothetical protein
MAELSPLRRRMIEDTTIRNMSPATQRSYIDAVSKFSRYFGRPPERLDQEDVRAFQVHLVSARQKFVQRVFLDRHSRAPSPRLWPDAQDS